MSGVVLREIVEHPVPGKALGRHIEHDPLSRGFAVDVEGVVIKTVSHPRVGGIFNQANIGSCTGEAIAGACNTKPTYKLGQHPVLTQPDALRCYEEATVVDGFPGAYPPNDTGSSGLAACKAAKSFGWITSYQHAFGVDQALAALMTRPVCFGVDWFEGFDDPDPSGLVKIAGGIRGGHEFVARGYDAAARLIWCDNSWGPFWGKAGRFCFTVATLEQLLAQQGDVVVPIRA